MGVEFDYSKSVELIGSSIVPYRDCAGGCGRKIAGSGWCRECLKGKEKYMKYRNIMVSLGERGHRCGSCGAYFGGCTHTYQALIIAIEENWPMMEDKDGI